MTSVAGKVVLITGGASGIGLETGRRLAGLGAHVVLVDRTEVPAPVVASLDTSRNGRHLSIGADVTDTESLERAVSTVLAEYGCLDVVVANAGIAEAGTVAISDVETLARIVDVNLIGVIRTVHATLSAVTAQRGFFLLVSSAAALKNVPGQSAYAAAKTGVEAFGGGLRLEVAHKGVGVGVAHPAFVRTPMFDSQHSIDAVRAGIEKLPWPFDVVTELGDCADAFVDAIVKRRRKVYVPGALRAVDTVRGIFTGRLWDAILRPKVKKTVPALERGILESRASGTLPRQ
ncbi:MULTISPECIES: short-chain dehydrogenase/reductase [Rhodococcus]|uniref:Short-chain dehydrogenase/reductase n=1 Tax=Rhodococcus oxybenzonivorans TaxID=1990687 RepID=A0AAE5A654_9NOCA|nr:MULTISPECIES: short-chain dehydrogenase/reductase [Rhodococcus]MDV7243455.1 short-chain dehydrogenase/reductase [Rhodococcus oxybenzonivorans]MDV7265161.1 short-chain dehydrogenase/reductase [Rhodococcus oxybenzonivorans]MDV7277431.1 short-chain dehydrogenase/reductase [Rhodococcus oxybenzonivorans]MDV7335541.1 short-chain dehydrogenase/reductase [Rhodococcus oxybenzonivorans]MDV7347143.1 short-chain dehydrogenase/reductase [Rhodococcus oxybenzonivorans]